MRAVRNFAKVEIAAKSGNFGRLQGLLCAGSIAWVGVWMPCKVLTWLWRLWPLVGVSEEILPLCFLIALSLGLLIRLGENLVTQRVRR